MVHAQNKIQKIIFEIWVKLNCSIKKAYQTRFESNVQIEVSCHEALGGPPTGSCGTALSILLRSSPAPVV